MRGFGPAQEAMGTSLHKMPFIILVLSASKDKEKVLHSYTLITLGDKKFLQAGNPYDA